MKQIKLNNRPQLNVQYQAVFVLEAFYKTRIDQLSSSYNQIIFNRF